jgi:hypothetical protein
MKSCEQYQAQLMEHLYGLLENEDSLALIEHAGRCEACRTALLHADSQRQLLAAAALTECPDIRFEAPTVRLAPATAAPAPPKRRALRLSRYLGRVAAAAVVLLAVAGMSLPVLYLYAERNAAEEQLLTAEADVKKVLAEERRLIDEHTAALARAETDRKHAEARREELTKQQAKELNDLADNFDRQQLYMVVTGHQSLRPGVPNEYRIETRNKKNERERVRLDVRIRDQASGKIVHEEKNVHSDGDHTVTLSPDASLKAGSQLALEVIAQSENNQRRGEIKEQLTLARSVYVTQLVTDKPMYQPGEIVRFRSLTLDRFSMKPAAEDFHLIFSLHDAQGTAVALYDEQGQEIVQLDQNGQKVNQIIRQPRVLLVDGVGAAGGGVAFVPTANLGAGAQKPKTASAADKQPTLRGIGSGAFQLKNLAGGEYTLQVQELDNKFPTEKRKLVIHEYHPQALRKELKSFDKSSYGAGEEATAHCKVTRAEGGTPLARRPVTATVRIDGKYYNAAGQPVADDQAAAQTLFTDNLGEVDVRFKLPAKIEKGDATLTVAFTDGSVYEPLIKPIPVAGSKLNIEFFPEGGDLVAGVVNRVYFQSRTLLDKPASIKGRIVAADGKKLADVETLNDPKPGINQGMGVFAITPEIGGKYQLVLETPVGIEGNFVLPEAKKDGVVLSVVDGVTEANQPIAVHLQNVGRERELLVTAYCRGVLLAHEVVTVKGGAAADVRLTPSGGVGGVYRVTVFEKLPPNANEPSLKPLAERLIYHQPAQRMHLAIDGKKTYAPGDKVSLTLKASSETGQALPSVLLVGVVDQSVLTMADERTTRSLPTHFLLTSEVRRSEDLEFADVLLGNHARAGDALDLLLGTQGWRRFLESDPERFKQQRPKIEDARCQADVQRLLVATGKMSLDAKAEEQVVNTVELDKERVLAKFAPQFEEVAGDLAGAEIALGTVRDNDTFQKQQEELHSQAAQANQGYAAALAHMRATDRDTEALRQRAVLAFGMVLLVAGLGSLVLAVARHVQRALPIYVAALGAVGLCGLVVFGSYLFDTQTGGMEAVARKEVPTKVTDEQDAMHWGMDANDAVRRAEPRPEGRALPEAEKRVDEAAAENDPRGRGHGAPKPQLDMAPRAPEARPVPEGKPGADKPLDDKKGDGARKLAPPAPPAAGFPVPNAQVGAMKDGKQAEANQIERGAKGKEAARAVAPGFAGQPMQDRFQEKAEQAAGPQNRTNLQREALERAYGFKRLEDMRKAAAGEAQGLPMEKELKNQDKDLRFRRQAQLAAALPCVVREYAHRRAPGTKNDEVRSDYAETLYWHPALVLPNGEVKIDFDLCDSVTSFQVLACGHSPDGRLGSTTIDIESRKPFTLVATTPVEVTATDIITLPVAVRNDSPEERQVQLSLALTNLKAVGGTESSLVQALRIRPNDSARVLIQLQPTVREGTARVVVRGSSEPFGSDSLASTIRIVPDGFPVTEAKSEVLEQNAEHEIVLPKQWVKDTLKVELHVYPSRLADLQQGLEGLLREPNGCFEQTSTSNYPNLLILNYLRETRQNQPQVEARALDLLARGYQKLTAFECRKPGDKREGYEWFGGEAPPHEALTAYGLMQFQDMTRINFPVDAAMVQRTRGYLMASRDGKGGFRRNERALDTFGRAPETITNAYIVWALTEADRNAAKDLVKEINALIAQAKTSKDPYFLALVANALLNSDRKDDAAQVLPKLKAAQKDDGCVDGAETSITGSGGRDLQIETTALTVLAWLKAPLPNDYQPALAWAIGWIGKQRGGHGGFGSTQSTILALKALIAYTKDKPSDIDPGEIKLIVNGTELPAVAITPLQKETLVLAVQNAEALLKAGEANSVQIKTTSKTLLPYTLTWSYQAVTPKNGERQPIHLSTKLDRDTARDGDGVHLAIEVQNTTDKSQGMVTAIIGLPSGLELPADMAQLKEWTRRQNDGKEPGKISFWEIRGRELVLYWRGLAPNQKVELDLALMCKVPGDYRGPASRAYLYYNADDKHWIDPVRVQVTPNAK